jgi:hypothetical protein
MRSIYVIQITDWSISRIMRQAKQLENNYGKLQQDLQKLWLKYELLILLPLMLELGIADNILPRLSAFTVHQTTVPNRTLICSNLG